MILQFGLPNRMQAALTEAGFTDVAAYSFDQSWHVANTDRYFRHQNEPSSGSETLRPFLFWLGCITNMSGYNFRKGQR